MTYFSRMKVTRGQQTRARIAATALEVLEEHGSAGLTMRRVAVCSGLSLSNVQYHYKTRNDLLMGITEQHIAICRDTLVSAVDAQGEASLRSVLRAALLNEEVLKTTPAFRELFALARSEPAVQASLTAYYSEGFEQLVAMLSQTFPAAESERVEEVATIVMTALEGMYLLAEATPVAPGRMAARLEDMVVTLLG